MLPVVCKIGRERLLVLGGGRSQLRAQPASAAASKTADRQGRVRIRTTFLVLAFWFARGAGNRYVAGGPDREADRNNQEKQPGQAAVTLPKAVVEHLALQAGAVYVVEVALPKPPEKIVLGFDRAGRGSVRGVQGRGSTVGFPGVFGVSQQIAVGVIVLGAAQRTGFVVFVGAELRGSVRCFDDLGLYGGVIVGRTFKTM